MATISVLNTSADLSGATLVTAEGARTITGLLSFSRSTSAPFAVNAGAAKVSNLEADKLDGQEGSYYQDPANLSSAVPVAKGGTALTGTPTNGQLLIGNGTGYALAALTAGAGLSVTNGAGTITIANSVLDKSTTEQEVVSTAAETSVYSFSVPGGTLSTNKSLRLTMTGSHLNNSGGASTLNIQVKLGGTVLAANAAISPAPSANRLPVVVQSIITANGLTNSQRVSNILYLGAVNATETSWLANQFTYQSQHSSLALDSTAALTLTVTITHSVSAATISFKRFAVLVELLG